MSSQIPEDWLLKYRAAYAAEPREVELLQAKLKLMERLLAASNDYARWAQAQMRRLSERVTGGEESTEFLVISEYIVANQNLVKELAELQDSNRRLQAARDKYKTLFHSGVANRRALVGFLRALDQENRQLREQNRQKPKGGD